MTTRRLFLSCLMLLILGGILLLFALLTLSVCSVAVLGLFQQSTCMLQRLFHVFTLVYVRLL